MTAGEIVLVGFPFSPREPQPFKRRPVLVLGSVGTAPDEAIFVAMITSNARRVAHPGPGDIAIPDWQASGLALPSVVRSRRLWTAEASDVVASLGMCGFEVVRATRDLVAVMLGLNQPELPPAVTPSA